MVTRALQTLASRLNLGADLRKVLRAAGLVMFVQVAASALSYLTQVLLARWLGAHEFGIYVFAWSWAVLLPVLASLGLSQAAVRFVPEYLAQGNWGRLRGLLRRGPVFVLTGGLIVALIGWLTLELLGERTPAYYVEPVGVALACIPLLALIKFLAEVSRGFGNVTVAYVPQQLVRPGLFILSVAILGLTRELNAATVMRINVAACLVTALGVFLVFRRIAARKVQPAPAEYLTRGWLRVALPLFLAEGVFVILWNIDTLMLGSMRPPGDVAVYDACMKTAGLTFFVFTAMSALAAPKFAEMYARGDRGAQVHFVRSIAQWTFWPSAGVALGVILLGRFILSIFGPDFLVGYPSLVVLAVGNLSFAVTGPTNAYLAGSGHQDDIVPAMATACLINIVLNALLIPDHGVMGASIASVVSIVVARVWLYAVVRRRLGLETFFLQGTPRE